MKTKKLHLVLTAFAALLFFSCSTFYKARQINSNAVAGSIDSLKKTNRFFILRSGTMVWHIKNIQMSADHKSAQCSLEPLSIEHTLHLNKGKDGKMKYKKNEMLDAGVVNEVHFYIAEDSTAVPGNYTLLLDKVYKIEVLEHDRKRTTNSYVLGAVGITLGVVAVAIIIIAATKSSCPFIFAYDGNGFSLQGEIYGGAVYPQLCRYDYLPLRMSPTPEGTLQLKITNELKERQYTDHVRLWKISHPADTRVFVDEQGNLSGVTDPQPPVEALLNGKRNILSSLEKTNDFNLIYMDDSSRAGARNEITMKFRKPAGVNNGRLILSLKNSYFLDLLYGELAKGFGTYYPTYISLQKKKTKAELLKWVHEQQIPLAISVNTEKGWMIVTNLTTVGPLAFRETALQLDLTQIKGDEVEIKLGCGFMFWEIDYAAMDFTVTKNFTVEKLNPVIATDETGKNVMKELLQDDGFYLEQPSIGNSVTIHFKSKTTDTGSLQSYILEAKGYYEHIRDFTNTPDLKFLEQFRSPGAFPLFGLNVYRKIKAESLVLATSN